MVGLFASWAAPSTKSNRSGLGVLNAIGILFEYHYLAKGWKEQYESTSKLGRFLDIEKIPQKIRRAETS
jgi:hypothetical protein